MSEECKEKSALVPRLRFPEFRRVDGWKSKKLKSLTSVITKGTTPTSLGYQFIESGINFIKIESISEEGSIDLSKVAAISKECNEALKRSQLEENDILFSIAGALGVIAVVKSDALPANTNQALAIVRLNEKNSLGFISAFLRSENVQSEISKIKAGAAQPNISLGQLSDFDVLMPEAKEQQKIADCLSSLDELITAETQKLDALKTHKKGLMQQLFPREGETLPRLRFPEFREEEEWEETTLDQLGELVSGLTYSPDDVREDGLLVLRSSNVQNGMIVLDDNVYVRPDINGANLSRPNDILICVRNGSKSLIGKNALIPEGMPPCTHGAFMTVFRSNSAKFIIQLFQTARYEQQVGADLGATINSINGNQLRKFTFLVPKSGEQKVIADFLASLDDLITAQSQKIDTLKIHKRGLMQHLFPVLDGVLI